MAYSETFLDDLKSRVAVSEVIGRSVKLRRDGKEFRAIDNKSLTVNDQKGIWFDHATNEGGDVLQWLQKDGLSFADAVADLASIAGVPLPNGNGQAPPRKQPAKKQEPKAKREITATYDYTDAQGELLYQVVRLEWIEDGERHKTFRQRRPDPEKPSEWLWNLEGISHGLYRLPDLREAGVDETVYLPEGEKDVETLIGFGLVATTNSGGAKNWRNDHAEALRGRDVVVMVDNDDPGRERGKTIVAALYGIASRVRVLDFSRRDIWPEAPKGADVTDWVKAREGTAEELAEIVGRLPDVKPPPFVSQFGGIPFEELDRPGPEHEFIIDGWLTVGEKSVIGGATKSGKSFLAIHMAMCIATGRQFYGNNVLARGLVIYQAGEGGRGIRKRFRAWRENFGIQQGIRVPVYILQSKVDIHSHEGDTAKLIEEIIAISRLYNLPVTALFIDTLAKAQGAADENSGRDMAVVMANVDRIAAAVPGCHVCLVHHMNAGGTKLRGHTSISANIDQVVLVAKEEGTKVRTATLDKQKDEEDGAEIRFELMQVEVGRRAIDGKPITSCVTVPAGTARTLVKGKTLVLSDDQTNIFTALKDAIADVGIPAPPELKLPKSIVKVCKVADWYNAYRAVASKEDAALRQAMGRASDKFVRLRIIGRINPYVWVTGRPVAELSNDERGEITGGDAIQEEFPEQEFAPR
ncbi:AAA family ATPase [Bradyrhizobium lablabi]|uniref:AAA family ATPase n=1 Tax=Bradyrhizobium lablabi TaxID=722472 RepID=UPI001BABC5E3|nr:AAA family ATPase [Bradyrhizobium lablabi]MBR0693622.1 AAA family ATPase [Bradyrhizobium lablabi]